MQGSAMAAAPMQSIQTRMVLCLPPPGLRQPKPSAILSDQSEGLGQDTSTFSRPVLPRPPPGLCRQQPDGLAPLRQPPQERRHITPNYEPKDSDLLDQDLLDAAPGPQANIFALQALHGSPTGRSKQAGPAGLAEGQVLHLCLQYMLSIGSDAVKQKWC